MTAGLLSLLLVGAGSVAAPPPHHALGPESAYRAPLGAKLVALSPDARQLAVAGSRGRSGKWQRSVHVFEVLSGRVISELREATEVATALAWSADGMTIAVGGGRGTLTLWDLPEGSQRTRTRPLGKESLAAMVVSPDGSRIVVSDRKGALAILAASAEVVARPAVSGRPLGYDRYGRLWVELGKGRVQALGPAGTALGEPCTLPKVGRYAWSWAGYGLRAGWVSRQGELMLHQVEPNGCRARTERRRWPGPRPRSELAARVSGDGRVVVASDGTLLVVWSDRGRRPALRRTPYTLAPATLSRPSTALSHDGGWLVLGGRSPVVVDTVTGAPLHPVPEHPVGIAGVAISADGSRVASLGSDGELVVWDRAAATALSRVEVGSEVAGVGLSANGRAAVVAAGDQVRVYAADGGTLRSQLSPLGVGIERMALAPDGRHVAVAATGTPTQTRVAVFDRSAPRATLRELTLPDAKGWVHRLAWSPDGSRLAVGLGSSHQVFVLDTRRLSIERRFNRKGGGGMAHLVFAPDGQRILCHAAFSKQAAWLSLRGGGSRRALASTSYAADAVFVAGGDLLALGDERGRIRLWDARTAKNRQVFPAHSGGTLALAASADGRWLVSAGVDLGLRVWDLGGNR